MENIEVRTQTELDAAQTRTECARLDWDLVRLQVKLLEIGTRGDDNARND